MKKIGGIALLVLLLYNTFGLSFAILLFNNQYEVAAPFQSGDNIQTLKIYLPSLPYSTNWESEDLGEGLLQNDGEFYNATHVKQENDTLYVTLKSNLTARDHFFELANLMEVLTNSESELPDGTDSKTLKLLSNLFKIYISSTQHLSVSDYKPTARLISIYQPTESNYISYLTAMGTPPPEKA